MRRLLNPTSTAASAALLALTGGALAAGVSSASAGAERSTAVHATAQRVGEPAELRTLQINVTEDGSADGDEPYILVNDNEVWRAPDSIDSPGTVDVRVPVAVGDTVRVKEADWPDPDDDLGSDTVTAQTDELRFSAYGVDYRISVVPR